MAKRSAEKILGTIKKKVGKAGSLTYEELGAFLGDNLDVELVDDIYCGLSEMGLEVVDKKTHEAKRKKEAKNCLSDIFAIDSAVAPSPKKASRNCC